MDQNDQAAGVGASGIDPFEWLWSLLPFGRPLQAVAAVLLSMVVAWLADLILCRVLRSWTRRTKLQIDDRLISITHGPVVKTIVLFGLLIAARRLELKETILTATERGLMTMGLVVWTLFMFRFVSLILRAVKDIEQLPQVEERTFPLFDNLGKIFIAGLAVYLFIVVWGIDSTGWLASAGLMGIAVSFAAKDTLANLFAGVFIIADAPYQIGDFINLESGERGQVTYIGLRSTRLLTRDDVEITIPNSVMGNARITNETGGPSAKHRVRVKVSVAYGTDVDRVREVLTDVAGKEPQVSGTPEPRVRFRDFGDSGVAFELLCWVGQPVLRGRVLDKLNTAVYKRFAAEGIEIPYAKQDLYVRELPRSSS